MNKTALKKSILFGLALILLVFEIVQITLSRRTKVKELSIKKEIDCVTIEKNNGDIRLEKIDGQWKISYMGSVDNYEKYLTEDYSVENILNSVKKLKLLGTVSGGSDSRIQRYGLDSASKIVVKVYGKKKLFRTLVVGKNSQAGSQSYVQVDDKKAVMVADSALHSVFDKTLPSLRKKNLYSISSDSISSVEVKNEGVAYELLLCQMETTDAEGNVVLSQQTQWTVAKNPEGMEDVVLDQGSVGTWIASLSSVDVSQWCEEDVKLPEEEPKIQVDIAVGGMVYSISMYKCEDEDKYLCTSNQTRGLFYISKSSAENLGKKLDDLLVKFEIPEGFVES